MAAVVSQLLLQSLAGLAVVNWRGSVCLPF